MGWFVGVVTSPLIHVPVFCTYRIGKSSQGSRMTANGPPSCGVTVISMPWKANDRMHVHKSGHEWRYAWCYSIDSTQEKGGEACGIEWRLRHTQTIAINGHWQAPQQQSHINQVAGIRIQESRQARSNALLSQRTSPKQSIPVDSIILPARIASPRDSRRDRLRLPQIPDAQNSQARNGPCA